MNEVLLEKARATNGCDGCYFNTKTKSFSCCGANGAFRDESVCNVLSYVETYIWREVK